MDLVLDNLTLSRTRVQLSKSAYCLMELKHKKELLFVYSVYLRKFCRKFSFSFSLVKCFFLAPEMSHGLYTTCHES